MKKTCELCESRPEITQNHFPGWHVCLVCITDTLQGRELNGARLRAMQRVPSMLAVQAHNAKVIAHGKQERQGRKFVWSVT